MVWGGGVLDPLPGVCVTDDPFSWVRSALPTAAPSLGLLPHYPPLYALLIPGPIYSHLLWQTVGMNRAANSTGSFKEGRSNLKVRTMDSVSGLLVQIPVQVENKPPHLSTATERVVIFCTFCTFWKLWYTIYRHNDKAHMRGGWKIKGQIQKCNRCNKNHKYVGKNC